MRAPLTKLIGLLMGGFAVLAQNSPPASAEATAHIGKGYDLEQNDRFSEAVAEFRAALALDPAAINARYQLGVCLLALGETHASREEFERLPGEAKNEPSVAYYLARLDLLDGNSAAAVRRLAPLLSHPPFPDTAFYLGSAYLAQGRLDDAIRCLRTGAQSDRRDFRTHYRLARALAQKGLAQEAEREYALSTEMREHYNESARQSTACVQALRKEPDAAAHDVCNRMFDSGDPDKLTTLGILYGDNGRYQDAIPPLTRAAVLDPDSFEVYHNLGLTYFRLRRFADARAPLEKAVGLRPNFFGSNALLGATLYSLKDDQGALRVLQFAHQLKPDDSDTMELLFRVLVILGNNAAAAGDYAAGLKYLMQAAELRPGSAELDSRIAEIKALAHRSR